MYLFFYFWASWIHVHSCIQLHTQIKYQPVSTAARSPRVKENAEVWSGPDWSFPFVDSSGIGIFLTMPVLVITVRYVTLNGFCECHKFLRNNLCQRTVMRRRKKGWRGRFWVAGSPRRCCLRRPTPGPVKAWKRTGSTRYSIFSSLRHTFWHSWREVQLLCKFFFSLHK